jgi:hypothetical protein
MFKVQASATAIVNYNCNMLRVHTSDTTIVNYNCKMFKVQALDHTLVNYNWNIFIVQAAGDAPFVTKKNDHESNLFSMATIVLLSSISQKK